MAQAPKAYAKLTRSVGGVATYQSLWLGSDHLMIVTSTGFSESYARLQLRDIKGFFLLRSDRRLGWGIAWGLLTAVFLVIVLAQANNGEMPVVSLIFFLVFAGAMLWNHLLGSGCVAYVVTGVQTARLPALVRIKKTRRVLSRLQPLIEAAQADLVMPAPPPMEAPAGASASGSMPVPAGTPEAAASPAPVAATPVEPAPAPTPLSSGEPPAATPPTTQPPS